MATKTTNWTRWTAAEEEILRREYPRIGLAVANMLPGKTYTGVRGKISSMEISGRKSPWTEDEIGILKKWYPIEGREVAKRLPMHTAGSANVKATHLGLTRKTEQKRPTKRQRWTNPEDDILRSFYKEEGPRVAKRLEGRTESACAIRASVLGITYQKNDDRFWTEEEYKVLRDFYPVDGEKVYLRLNGRTKEACVAMARKLQLQAPSKDEVWSIEDLAVFMKFFPEERFAVLNRLSGEHTSLVSERLARRLGFLPEDGCYPRWEDGEDKIIAERFEKESAETCRHLPRRTRQATLQRGYDYLNAARAASDPAWTEEEISLLRRAWKIEGEAAALRVPRHTRDAVLKRACVLGLVTEEGKDMAGCNSCICKEKVNRPKKKCGWTNSEINILRRYYPDEGGKVASRIAGTTPQQCRTKAWQLGIGRNRPSSPKTARCIEDLYTVYAELTEKPSKGMRTEASLSQVTMG